MRKLFFVFLFLLTGTVLPAQDPVYYDEDTESAIDDVQNVPVDSEIVFRYVASRNDSVNRWRNDERFAYMKTLDSLLRTSDEEEEQSAPRVSSGSNTVRLPGIFKILLWLLAAAFIAWIVYSFFVNKGAFKRERRQKPEKEKEVPEEIPSDISEYDKRARSAAAAGDLRSAVRWQYLGLLHALGEQQLIVFSADKTNRDYYNELRESLRPAFAKLSLYYEFIWYGRARISDADYAGIDEKFKHLRAEI